MEFRIEKAALGLILLGGAGLWSAGGAGPWPAAWAAEFRYEARHDHWRKSGPGTLVISESGVTFEETAPKKKHPHRFDWRYEDIQQLEIFPARLRVLTYEDNRWKLGADREQTFLLSGGQSFRPVYELLKGRLDQRLVAALTDESVRPLWQLPVKHLGTIRGSQGTLVAAEDRIVYETGKPGESRTWRYRDIDNISTSGPFELTLITFERARSHYGNRKQFNFQLKQALDEDRYNDLWRRLNRTKGLRLP